VTLAAAHGVRLEGLPPTPWLSLDGAQDWPAARIAWEARAGGPLVVDVAAGRVGVRAGIAPEEVVHPLSTGIGLHFAVARGFDAVHAGAVAGPSGTWAVAGSKGAGKSTLLAACARQGLAVVSDDALIYDGRRCFAGPRSIDLREAAAERFGAAVAVRGSAARRRLTLPPITGEHRLAGMIHLAWGREPALRPVSASDSLAQLLERHREDGFPRNPVGMMDVAALPAYELVRPREWGRLAETVRLLQRLVAPMPTRVPSRAAA